MSRKAHGLRAWLLQRFTAVYLALFFLYLLYALIADPIVDYAQWRAWMSGPLMNLATGIFILALLLHAWVGIRDVIMDYIHPAGVRVSALAVVALVLVACALWGLRALFVLTL